ncbi:hypothetical protein ONZ45_g1867 [Pleurotus djamor]|nr:hypothetical protein ONZ45_g1867 [Pleurotus djamor]
MLDEIASESFQSLLASFRSDFVSHPSLHNLLPFSTKPGDVIEVKGPSASGKSHLIYHVLANCLIPPACDAHVLGGCGKSAILCDNDGTFNVSRLFEVLVNRLASKLATDPRERTGLPINEWAHNLARQCLGNLHVFKPTSSAQLAATLLHIPKYHVSNLTSSEIGVLAIDSLSAFYWNDRFTMEQLRPSGSAAPPHNTASHPFQNVVTALETLHTTLKPLIIFTTWHMDTFNSFEPFSNSQLPQFGNAPVPRSNQRHQLSPSTIPLTHRIKTLIVHTPLPSLTTARPALDQDNAGPGSPVSCPLQLSCEIQDLKLRRTTQMLIKIDSNIELVAQ